MDQETPVWLRSTQAVMDFQWMIFNKNMDLLRNEQCSALPGIAKEFYGKSKEHKSVAPELLPSLIDIKEQLKNAILEQQSVLKSIDLFKRKKAALNSSTFLSSNNEPPSFSKDNWEFDFELSYLESKLKSYSKVLVGVVQDFDYVISLIKEKVPIALDPIGSEALKKQLKIPKEEACDPDGIFVIRSRLSVHHENSYIPSIY